MTETVAPPARRWPLIPTIVVLIAVAVMIALGIWQLQRKADKEALIALYQRNTAMSALVTYPELPPVADNILYRKSSVVCLEPVRWDPRSGTDQKGRTGFRMIADCRTGAEGPGVLVDVGIGDDFTPPKWTGGIVQGTIVPGPEQPTVMERMIGKATPARAMLIADTPAAGLRASAVPSADDTPNNHLAYAGQWFLFAAAALLIYILAVRRRLRP
ncbi:MULTISPECIES: SURF1 family protein [unclassified Sphingopyxis]|uniref:SURF1 family protein n=1 Tax=unclassified Sphingopyxis TaxID=2614943 RepID=UPI0028618554|nr:MULTISPECIES: SURF1 family protein [unclassified Sphingopyxis]MDR6834868.1 cytochrome oxidase assembly protein ShyY1 [Sphingopyxis sp. BE122]MDR7227139.1 cytochrome oxidase assembly protein ShyY1 [Sphingopyxis sp. BE259]